MQCTLPITSLEAAYASTALSGARLAFGLDDSTICTYDKTSDRPLVFLLGHQGTVHAVASLPDGRLVSGSADNTIRIWDIDLGSSKALVGHNGAVRCIEPLTKNSFASGSEDKTIRVWDSSTGQCTARLIDHRGPVNCLAAIGNDYLVSGSGDRTMRLWDLTSRGAAPRVLFVADAAITALAWIPTHQLLVAGDASGRLHWLEMVGISPDGIAHTSAQGRPLFWSETAMEA